MPRYASLLAVLLVFDQAPLAACDLCPGSQGPPLSWQVAQAQMVVYGSIASAKLGADGVSGTSELKIEAVIKPGEQLKEGASISLPRYVPPDPKIKFVIFLSAVKGQLDPYRGLPFTTPNILKYLQQAPSFNPKSQPEEKAERLRYYFPFLNAPETEISGDAYREFATASNLEVGLASTKLAPDLLRAWLVDPKTPAGRLGLYGFLLGACGGAQDAETLRRLLLNPTERTDSATDGLLAGYIRLQPQEGWKMTMEIVADGKRPFLQRFAILRLLRFYYGYQPKETKAHALHCLGIMLQQPDINDLAVEQLRGWKLWDHTDQVLSLYGKREADSPIAKRAILRYALTCPLPVAKKFLDDVRRKDPELVKDVEEALQFETMKP